MIHLFNCSFYLITKVKMLYSWNLEKREKHKREKNKNDLSSKDNHFNIWVYVLLLLLYAWISIFFIRVLSVCACHFVGCVSHVLL